jgi:hypothetical protein
VLGWCLRVDPAVDAVGDGGGVRVLGWCLRVDPAVDAVGDGGGVRVLGWCLRVDPAVDAVGDGGGVRVLGCRREDPGADESGRRTSNLEPGPSSRSRADRGA